MAGSQGAAGSNPVIPTVMSDILAGQGPCSQLKAPDQTRAGEHGDPPQLRDQPVPCCRPRQHRRRTPADVPPAPSSDHLLRPQLTSIDLRSPGFAIALPADAAAVTIMQDIPRIAGVPASVAYRGRIRHRNTRQHPLHMSWFPRVTCHGSSQSKLMQEAAKTSQQAMTNVIWKRSKFQAMIFANCRGGPLPPRLRRMRSAVIQAHMEGLRHS